MKLTEHVNQIRELIVEKIEVEFMKQQDNSKITNLIDDYTKETGSLELAKEKAIDEFSFTLFNQIASIKVMESHNLFPPIIVKDENHGNRSLGHKIWLENNPDMKKTQFEGIKAYIEYEFSELSKEILLFKSNYPYSLIPDATNLNEIINRFNEVEKDDSIEDNIWKDNDILGWLYESYNNAKKEAFKLSKKKTEYDKVSLQSQVYTPSWVVKFLVENSLGKLYLEMYPDSEIGKRYKIAGVVNTPPEDEASHLRTPLKRGIIKKIEEIKIIDPASGSGNFLLYAFDFFYELYLDQIENYDRDDIDEDDIPQLIIENNLHGIDLDDRAIQLAQLGLYIKAKRKYKRVKIKKFNLVSSDFYLPEFEKVKDIFDDKLTQEQGDLIEEIWGDLRNAYKFGSLIRVNERFDSYIDELKGRESNKQGLKDLFVAKEKKDFTNFRKNFFKNLKKTIKEYAISGQNSFLVSKTQNAIVFLELITKKYDVATANPPYTDSSAFGKDLKKFINDNYKKNKNNDVKYDFHMNLYATFIKRCYELTNDNGKIALIHPHTFMFIKSFEDVRKFMIEKTHIDLMVDFGLDRVNLFGTGILLDATFYVLSKNKANDEGIYFNLTTNLQEKYKKDKFLEALDDLIEDKPNSRFSKLEQSKLKIIKSWPFIYWISDEFREKFGGVELSKIVDICKGMDTSFNIRFIRFWWEIFENKVKESWKVYSKGGPYNKWFGNLWTIINWENNGNNIKSYPTSTIRNERFYFIEGITYSTSGSKGASFRYLPKNSIFDAGGNGLFIKKNNASNILAFMNSDISSYIRNALNPTVNTTIGDLGRIPFVIPSPKNEKTLSILAEKNIEIKKHLTEFSIIEPLFKRSAIYVFDEKHSLKDRIKDYLDYENYLLTEILINEAIINEKVFEIYELTQKDIEMVLEKEGQSIGGMAVLKEARDAFTHPTEPKHLDSVPLHFSALQKEGNLFEYIENLDVDESINDRKSEIMKKFDTLYQANNDLEEFCKKNKINPINVWYWFKENYKSIPKQRMNKLALEFLTDMIREILNEDDDGVVPLVKAGGVNTIYEKIQEKFHEKGFSDAQFLELDTLLGRNLNDYLNNNFFKEFSDHLNLFMYLPKTPFIWHITTGKEQGFDAYIIIYKWTRDKLMTLKSVYLENRKAYLINQQLNLENNESAEAQNKKEKIRLQLKEIAEFEVKVDKLLADGYNPILDDGVGKNIAPLQKYKMIAYDVLNAGQLKKYLNADW
jgi:antitoxin component of RelBE/YafQ-DinJ toxin-antitoxin module